MKHGKEMTVQLRDEKGRDKWQRYTDKAGSSNKYFCVECVCVNECVCAHMYVCLPSMSGIFISHSAPDFFETGYLIKPRAL